LNLNIGLGAKMEVWVNGSYFDTLNLYGCGELKCDRELVFSNANINDVTAIYFYNIVDTGGINFDTFTFVYPDATPTPTPTPAPTPTPQILSIDFARIDSTLDMNPKIGGGYRLFPDKQDNNDSVNRAKVRVVANTTYPANTTIYFSSYDLDDPSQDPVIDANGGTGNDNRDALQFGSPSSVSALTDANGTARLEFTTGKQPGDNYAVVASANSSYLQGITAKENGLFDASNTPVPSKQRSPMLTVWRKLYIEDVTALNDTYSLMEDSDNPDNNIFADAYIRPNYAWAEGKPGYNDNDVPFKLNIPGTDPDDPVPINQQIALGRDSVNDASSSFWISYLQIGYQHVVNMDKDPNSEGGAGGATTSVGSVDEISGCTNVPRGGAASILFIETMRDSDVYRVPTGDLRSRTAPHEVGHQFGLQGDTQTGFGIMSYSGPRSFDPRHINILRCRRASPGQI
jgi:hypothetical protein